jgi:hypothetical protein
MLYYTCVVAWHVICAVGLACCHCRYASDAERLKRSFSAVADKARSSSSCCRTAGLVIHEQQHMTSCCSAQPQGPPLSLHALHLHKFTSSAGQGDVPTAAKWLNLVWEFS